MTPAVSPGDRWHDDAGYQAYIGRWSRPVAAEFVPWLGVEPGGRWVDVGCGTGMLAQTILQQAGPASVLGVDPSPAFIGAARAGIADSRATFTIGSAEAIPLGDSAAEAVASGLVLNFVPSVEQALAEMRRVTAPGGTIGAYVWDYAGEMQLLRRFWDAAVALDPAAVTLDEGPRFPMCEPSALEAAFDAAGLAGVAVRAIDVATVFRDFDDYWGPFLTGVGPGPGYVASLDSAGRDALRARLAATLPYEPDGSIRLVARAWAVRGRA